MLKIRDKLKRSRHYNLLDRLIEHRQDVYDAEDRKFTTSERAYLMSRLFPTIKDKMKNDAEQYCEALLVEANYFLTNDSDFLKAASTPGAKILASRVRELPFIIERN